MHRNHSKLVAGCRFGLSLTQNGSQPFLSRPSALMGLGLLWSYLVLFGVAQACDYLEVGECSKVSVIFLRLTCDVPRDKAAPS